MGGGRGLFGMNYFAHGCRFVDDPYFVAGTAVPDWLNLVDRRARARSKVAVGHVEAADPRVAAIARGVVQHHHDDDWFHRTRAFAELNWQFTVEIRELLGAEAGMRPTFVGHILVELLLDSVLFEARPDWLDRYYAALAALEPQVVADAVQLFTPRNVGLLATLLPRFYAERFLYDYVDDGKLLGRLNGVMRRVGLAALPAEFCSLLPAAREAVRRRASELLAGGTGFFSDP